MITDRIGLSEEFLLVFRMFCRRNSTKNEESILRPNSLNAGYI